MKPGVAGPGEIQMKKEFEEDRMKLIQFQDLLLY